MQNSFQLAKGLQKGMIILSLAPFICLMAQAEPFTSPTVENPKSRVRLLSGGAAIQAEYYKAGLEIELSPAAMTYWRTPGEAGVPPVFSFAGSRNLAQAKVLFPVPQRLEEEGGPAFGYKKMVIFPLHIMPVEAEKPVVLRLHLDYAVCEKICLPENANLTLEFKPGELAPKLQLKTLEQAEKAIPLVLPPQQIQTFVGLERIKSGAGQPNVPTWRLIWSDGPPKDLFAEAPEGWNFNIEKTGDPQEFLLSAVEQPQTNQISDPIVVFTIVLPDQSFEFELALKAQPDQN
jgi:hypothetical protein